MSGFVINIILVVIIILVLFSIWFFRFNIQNKVMLYIGKILFDKENEIKNICIKNKFIFDNNGECKITSDGINFYSNQSNLFISYFAFLLSILSIALTIFSTFCR